MGLCSGRLLKKEEYKVLMLGLDAAGKTTMLYKIKVGEIETTSPTFGFNVENVIQPRGPQFTMWDIGGQERIRPLWKHYYKNTDVLLYVVDSSDRERISVACDELQNVMEAPEMTKLPLLVAANKQDLPESMTPEELTENLNLNMLKGKWDIQGTCAVNGDGLPELMKALTKLVRQKSETQQ